MPLVIAEAGVNHNGDVARAHAMIMAAADAGADVVKFQAFSASKLVARGTRTAAYQARNARTSDQEALLTAVELKPEDFIALAQTCARRGIEFLCTAFDDDLLEMLIGVGMKRIKIPSGELTNDPMLRKAATFGLPIVLSTGMASHAEVGHALEVLRSAGARDVTILHCTSLYPAPDDAINLRAMREMGRAFGAPVGYSDHSLGDHIAVAAVALGAVMIEKHFTLDRGLPGPDHQASLEPGELAAMVRKLRATEAALGDGIKRPAPGEAETAALVRRSWHAARDLAAGSVLQRGDLVLKRPADGLPPGTDPVGRRIIHARSADEPVRLSDLAG